MTDWADKIIGTATTGLMTCAEAAQALRDERERSAKIVKNIELTAPAVISETAREEIAAAIRNQND